MVSGLCGMWLFILHFFPIRLIITSVGEDTGVII